MLKLIENEIPSGVINWINKEFTTSWFIWYVTNVVVDWTEITSWYTYALNKLTLAIPATVSITISFFYREERVIMGNWEVTMWDLIEEVYDEIGRKQYSKVYPKEKIRRDLNKTMWIYIDEMNEKARMQTYSFKGLNWLKVSTDWHTVDLTKPEAYPLAIEWSFLVGKWIYYNYYDYDNWTFTVSWADLIDAWDRILVWHRIPYGVDKVANVQINGIPLDYIDSRDFYMETINHYTIITDYQWNDYLYLPYSEKLYTAVIKYVPDYSITTTDEDIINIPYKYTRVFVYDECYRLLASREDERWQIYEKLKNEEKQVYKAYEKSRTKWTRRKIRLASVYWEDDRRLVSDILPAGVYDNYTT